MYAINLPVYKVVVFLGLLAQYICYATLVIRTPVNNVIMFGQQLIFDNVRKYKDLIIRFTYMLLVGSVSINIVNLVCTVQYGDLHTNVVLIEEIAT